MNATIERPNDPYSPLWSEYWAQNLGMHRGIGSDAVEEGGEADGGQSDDADGESENAAAENGEDPKAEKAKEKDKPLSDADAKLLKEVMQKKDKIKAQSDEIEALKSQLSQFDGIDVTEVKKLLSERQEAQTKQLEAKGEWDKLKAQMAQQHSATVSELKSQIEELSGQLSGKQSVIEDLTIGHSFGNSKFVSDDTVLTPSKARIVYGNHFDIVDGKIVAYDAPRGSGERAPLVDASGDPLPFDEALQKIVDADPDRDAILRSKMKPGASSDTKSGPKPSSSAGLFGASKIQAALGSKK